jgi:hypothetical protein
MSVSICYIEGLGHGITAKLRTRRGGSNQSGWLVDRAAVEVDLEVILGQFLKK